MKQFENLCGWKKKETRHYHQTKNIQIQNAKKTFWAYCWTHVVKLDASVFGMRKLNKKYWQFFSVCVGEAW